MDYHMARAGLPTYMVLKSNATDRFVCHAKEGVHKPLSATEADMTSPLCKFQLEVAKIGQGLFNIRCCYNNKYWVVAEEHSLDITAAAEKPNEDQSQWSCTLFEPVHVKDAAKTIQLRSFHSGMFVEVNGDTVILPEHGRSLFGGDDPAHLADQYFRVTDWESLVILPKHVAFVRHTDYFLSATMANGDPLLRFNGRDIGDPTVAHEIIPGPDGSVQIKSTHLNKYWTRHGNKNWICTHYEQGSDDKEWWFVPVKAGNHVALRNVGNNCYCRSHTDGKGRNDCLVADSTTITDEVRVTVQEIVLSRTVFNVRYRISDARIYDESAITVVTRDATNESKTADDTMPLEISYKETSTSSWNRSTSLKGTVETTFKLGIPFIVDGEVKVSAEVEGKKEWGEEVESSVDIVAEHSVIVPPMTRVRVTLVATRGKCDVPYSYSVRDLRTNGETVIYHKDDGVYVGANNYTFKFVSTEEKL